jgi:hypothetical protein
MKTFLSIVCSAICIASVQATMPYRLEKIGSTDMFGGAQIAITNDTWFAYTNAVCLESKNLGVTWSPTLPMLDRSRYVSVTAHNGNLAALSYTNLLFVSTTNGESWQKQTVAWPEPPSQVCAGNGALVVRSKRGTLWRMDNAEPIRFAPQISTAIDVVEHNNSFVVLLQDGSVMMITDTVVEVAKSPVDKPYKLLASKRGVCIVGVGLAEWRSDCRTVGSIIELPEAITACGLWGDTLCVAEKRSALWLIECSSNSRYPLPLYPIEKHRIQGIAMMDGWITIVARDTETAVWVRHPNSGLWRSLAVDNSEPFEMDVEAMVQTNRSIIFCSKEQGAFFTTAPPKSLQPLINAHTMHRFVASAIVDTFYVGLTRQGLVSFTNTRSKQLHSLMVPPSAQMMMQPWNGGVLIIANGRTWYHATPDTVIALQPAVADSVQKMFLACGRVILWCSSGAFELDHNLVASKKPEYEVQGKPERVLCVGDVLTIGNIRESKLLANNTTYFLPTIPSQNRNMAFTASTMVKGGYLLASSMGVYFSADLDTVQKLESDEEHGFTQFFGVGEALYLMSTSGTIYKVVS